MFRRKFLALLALGGLAALFARQKAYFTGVSPHFFDGVFVDPQGSAPKPFSDLLKWQWAAREKRQAWPEFVNTPQQDVPPARADMRVTFIGHASWLYQIDNLNILVDPVYSERAGPMGIFGPKRVTKPGIALENLPLLDYILITHNHYDHLDGEALREICKKHQATLITPLGNDTILKDYVGETKILTMDWGNATQLKNNIMLHCEPCRHWSARGVFDRNKALWACFVMATSKGNILHIGDTGFGNGGHFKSLREKFKTFSLAILPIGAYEPRWFMADQHVNPQEAVQIFEMINAKTALASHWGTFQLTDEARGAPVEDLKATGVSLEAFKVLQVGETYST